MEELAKQFIKHMEDDRKDFEKIQEKLDYMTLQVSNHLPTAINELKNDVSYIRGMLDIKFKNGNGKIAEEARQSTNIEWIKWFIQGASMSVIAGIIALILRFIK